MTSAGTNELENLFDNKIDNWTPSNKLNDQILVSLFRIYKNSYCQSFLLQ